MIVARSSGRASAARRRTASRSARARRGRAPRTSSSESVPSGKPGPSSMRITWRSCGAWSRTSASLRACSAFETNASLGLAVVQDVEHLGGRAASRRSARRAPPRVSVARSANAHSGRFSERMATRSPFSTPSARRPSDELLDRRAELVGADVVPDAVLLELQVVGLARSRPPSDRRCRRACGSPSAPRAPRARPRRPVRAAARRARRPAGSRSTTGAASWRRS